MTDMPRKDPPAANTPTLQPVASEDQPLRSRKRTLHDYFGGKAPPPGLRKAPRKRPKTQAVAPLDRLSLTNAILIASDEGGNAPGSPIRLLTRQQYLNREGLEQPRAGRFPVTQSELDRLGHLSMDKNRCYQLVGTIAEKLKGRDLIIRDIDGHYRAVNPKTHATLNDIRTLDEAHNRFGAQHVWFRTSSGEFSSPEGWEKSGRYRSAPEKFAEIMGRVHERPGSNLPEAIYRLPNGDYADRQTFDTQWRAERDRRSRPAERSEDSVLVRTFGGKGFVTPYTLKMLASTIGDEDYYRLKMNRLGLDEKSALAWRDPAPAILAAHRFETNLFISGDRLAKMDRQACRGLVDEDRTLVQNRNLSGRRTGNFSSLSYYKSTATPVDAEQAKILKLAGFLDFKESVPPEKTANATAHSIVQAAPTPKVSAPSSASAARGEIANRGHNPTTRETF